MQNITSAFPNALDGASVRIIVRFNIAIFMIYTQNKLQIQLVKSTTIIKSFVHTIVERILRFLTKHVIIRF